MMGQVDFNKTVEYLQQDKWTGWFPIKWHIMKDIPNSLLKHVILEYNENKLVTNSRHTQEMRHRLEAVLLGLVKKGSVLRHKVQFTWSNQEDNAEETPFQMFGIIRNLGIGNGDQAACQGHLEVCKYLVEELGCHPNMAATGGSC